MSDSSEKSRLRKRADEIKEYRCKNLIAVIENPDDYLNIGSVIRNVNALGAEKVYVIDSSQKLPKDWENMREQHLLKKKSASAVKWTFVKRFDSTDECLLHLGKNGFVSVVTSPYQKGKINLTLAEADFTKHYKLAVWFGNERNGISDLAVEKSEMCVSIPMFGIVESLNLGTTSGIVLYEVAKQRRAYVENKIKKKKNA